MSRPTYKIRPAARLIRTIGQDLIKDVYAAIVELVKNSYDADSPNVVISFNYEEKSSRLTISVEDHGHGMSSDIVCNQWLVPATDDKLKRRTSAKKRVLQGRKGIGRFAAAILGQRILLETTQSGTTTSLILDMEELESTQYLDEFDIPIDVVKTGKPDGTRLEIEKDGISSEQVKAIWTPKQIHKLLVELRSLTAPAEVYETAKSQGFEIQHDKFEIELRFNKFPDDKYSDQTIEIKPFPVLDLYDYKISGKVDANGNAELEFENQNIPSLPPQHISLNIPLDSDNGQTYPGEIFLDLRVYDRDPDSIENIIKRGLKDPTTGEYVGKQEARKILDEYYGVGIYREQFRIRPYGEPSFDWLELDKKRVQDPSNNIGHNQTIGFVYIRSEEQSGLKEKSARDGLVENGAYSGLVTLVSQAINQLATRRRQYRQQALKGGRRRTLQDEVDSLFDFDDTRKRINKELNELGIARSDRERVGVVVDKVLDDEKQKKSAIARKIRDTIAIYQGQATLGKITHVLLHEGRKHIKYISETVPRIANWSLQMADGPNESLSQKIEERGSKVITHAKGLSHLFARIEPLARTRRAPNKNLNLKKEVEATFNIFASELNSAQISYEVDAEEKNLSINGNEMDFITVLSNLIENSIYWLGYSTSTNKKISVNIFRDKNHVLLEYFDNGPGFQGDNLSLMFEPGYSMKPNGTGLGLALAGEAIGRLGGKIEAKKTKIGALFEIIFGGD
ncbi:sensor histidine kinase [Microbulbifer thermotolerans]|uniref:sensor histidine kinase n=1 Tax=Microbulbifer thermotolerans TaxID=252514 RepID=UPI000943B4EB|nr:ATP-binding protein [Microbulbifer thermotolerans]